MSAQKIQVLLIEDNDNHANYIASILSSKEFQIKSIYDGKQAFDYLLSPQIEPDVIIVDNNLPGMEGLDIIRYFITRNYNYAFIILTGDNSIDLAVKALKLGAYDYVTKSLNIKDELEIICKNAIKRNILQKEKIALEKKLKERELLFRNQYKNLPIPTYTWKKNGDKFVLIDYNYEAEKVTNGNVSKLINASTDELYADQQYVSENIKQCNAQKKVLIKEHAYNYTSIKLKQFLKTTYVPVSDNLVMVHAEDITDRIAYENTIKSHVEKMEHLNATKDKLFSIIGHDLRGPIGSFKGLIELVLDDEELHKNKRIKNILSVMQNTATSTFDLLENLLLWSRSQQNNIVFNKTVVNPYNMVQSILDLLQENISQKELAVYNNLSILKTDYADKDMLMLVFRNLITNAVKFTPRQKSICIYAEENDDMTLYVVKDEGVGIKDEYKEKVFMPSENITTVGTENEKGSGLGLVLCKEFVEKHGGKIFVNSKVGYGSEFIFSIPK